MTPPPVVLRPGATLNEVADSLGTPINYLVRRLHAQHGIIATPSAPLSAAALAALETMLNVRPAEPSRATTSSSEREEAALPSDELIRRTLALEVRCEAFDKIAARRDSARQESDRKRDASVKQAQNAFATAKKEADARLKVAEATAKSAFLNARTGRDQAHAAIETALTDGAGRIEARRAAAFAKLPGLAQPKGPPPTLPVPIWTSGSDPADRALVAVQAIELKAGHAADQLSRMNRDWEARLPVLYWSLGLSTLIVLVVPEIVAICVAGWFIVTVRKMREEANALLAARKEMEALAAVVRREANASLDAQVAQAESAVKTAQADATRSFSEAVSQAQSVASAASAAAESAHRSETNNLAEAAKKELGELSQMVGDEARQLRRQAALLEDSFATAPWSDPRWSEWSPAETPSERCRVGTYAFEMPRFRRALPGEAPIEIPAVMDFFTARPWLVRAKHGRSGAVSWAQSIVARAFATQPPGGLHALFADPIDAGANAAPFMRLTSVNDRLVSGKAWTSAESIADQLARIAEHIETVVQQRLGAQYKTVRDYNRAADVPESLYLLTLFDFPAGLTDSSARLLANILRNGPRCGVQTILIADPDRPLPRSLPEAELAQLCAVLSDRGEAFGLANPLLSSVTLWPDALPEAKTLAEQLDTVGARSKDPSKNVVEFEAMMARAGVGPLSWQEATTTNGIGAPLGMAGAKGVLSLAFGSEMEHHALVVGQTGSGKTNMMNVLICGLALKYSPEELELWLMDFKRGVAFKRYADLKLPHARVVALQSDAECAVVVLEGLKEELERRGRLFGEAGVDEFPSYRKFGHRMSRILLIADEFQEFFRDEGPHSREVASLLDMLAKQGRSFGIHLLMGTQSLQGVARGLSTSTQNQMTIRVALPCSAQDSRLIFSDENTEASTLKRQGEAICNNQGGAPQGNRRLQVAKLDLEVIVRTLHDVAERTARPAKPIILRGNVPANPEEGRAFEVLPERAGPLSLSLGEPADMAEDCDVELGRNAGANLVFAATQETQTYGPFLGAWLSGFCRRPASLRCVLIEGVTDEAAKTSFAALAEGLEERCARFPAAEALAALEGLAAEIEARRSGASTATHSILLLLPEARSLPIRVPEIGARPSPGDPSAAAAKALAGILANGPYVGVHVLITVDSVATLESIVGRNLREVAFRAVGAMSTLDLNKLTEQGPTKLSLKDRMALVNANDTSPKKFRPYILPTAAWLAQKMAEIKNQ